MSNNSPSDDRSLFSLVQKVVVPKGFRPETDDEIDTMLAALGTEPVTDSKLARMLGKIRGELPLAWEKTSDESIEFSQESAEARELAELYRSQGKPIPPELAAKLKEMEGRASRQPGYNENQEGG